MLYTVKEEEAGERLDTVLARVADVSRSAVVKWLEASLVSVEGKKATKSLLLEAGDVLHYQEPTPVP